MHSFLLELFAVFVPRLTETRRVTYLNTDDRANICGQDNDEIAEIVDDVSEQCVAAVTAAMQSSTLAATVSGNGCSSDEHAPPAAATRQRVEYENAAVSVNVVARAGCRHCCTSTGTSRSAAMAWEPLGVGSESDARDVVVSRCNGSSESDGADGSAAAVPTAAQNAASPHQIGGTRSDIPVAIHVEFCGVITGQIHSGGQQEPNAEGRCRDDGHSMRCLEVAVACCEASRSALSNRTFDGRQLLVVFALEPIEMAL